MLKRQLSLLEAVSLNMGLMVGVGPFITIPLFVGAMGGPQAMIGWVLGVFIAIADGLVWSELAAAFPGSGGTYHFFDAIYGRSTFGRLLKFLFVWQFLFSGPLELASGAMGLTMYAGFFWPVLKQNAWTASFPAPVGTWEVTYGQLAAMAAMLGITALAYRRIKAAGRLMVVLWAGMIGTVLWVIVAGLSRFDSGLAFGFPPGAFALSARNARGLGVALGIAMYDFFGYYQICYLGDEVRDPARTIPRSILISVIAVAGVYLTMNVGILGTLPVSEVIASKHIASDFMLRRFGPGAAKFATGLILWTGTASVFAGILGYSRVPYAAARAGHFFRGLAKDHPTKNFPHRSLILIGGLSVAACLVDLPTLIGALIASRIVVQFGGQILAVFHLRADPALGKRLVFRMPLFPLPAILALLGWLYIFGTLDLKVVLFGLASLSVGAVAFIVWDSRTEERSGGNPIQGD